MRFRLLVSWTWFFLVLFSYYVLKPVRDALATETRLFGPLYLATFLAVCAALPLYWRIVAAHDAAAARVRRVPVFRCVPGRVCRAAGARAWRRGVAAERVLRVGERVQPVCRGRVLERDGGLIFGRGGQDLVWRRGRGRDGGLDCRVSRRRPRRPAVGRGLADGSGDRRAGVIDRDGVAGLAIRAARQRHVFQHQACRPPAARSARDCARCWRRATC